MTFFNVITFKQIKINLRREKKGEIEKLKKDSYGIIK